jgi:hypothetical protein
MGRHAAARTTNRSSGLPGCRCRIRKSSAFADRGFQSFQKAWCRPVRRRPAWDLPDSARLPEPANGRSLAGTYLLQRFWQALRTVSRTDEGSASHICSKLVAYARKTTQIIARRISIVLSFVLPALATSPATVRSMLSRCYYLSVIDPGPQPAARMASRSSWPFAPQPSLPGGISGRNFSYSRKPMRFSSAGS